MTLHPVPRGRNLRPVAATLGLMAVACATETALHSPSSPQHPARATADAGEIVHPGAWLAQSEARGAAPATSASTVDEPRYTCPMHPDVGAMEPGVCPRCGMPLAQRAPSSSPPPEPDHEH